MLLNFNLESCDVDLCLRAGIIIFVVSAEWASIPMGSILIINLDRNII